MKREFRVTFDQPTLHFGLDFNAQGLSIENPTPFDLYVIRGSQNIPDRLNFDYLVPSGTARNIPVTFNEFGFRLVITSNTPSSNTNLPVTIIAYRDEIIPAYSSVVYTSKAQNNFVLAAGNQTSIIIETATSRFMSLIVTHNATGGNPAGWMFVGAVIIEQSYDGVTYYPYKTRNMWGTQSNRKFPQEIFTTPANYIRVTVKALEAMAGVIAYSFIDFAMPITKEPYTFTFINGLDGTASPFPALSSATWINHNIIGKLKSITANISRGAASGVDDMNYALQAEIEIDNDVYDPVRIIFGRQSLQSVYSMYLHQHQPITFFDQNGILGFIHKVDVDLSFESYLKITVSEIANVSMQSCKFLFQFEDFA